MPCGHVLQSLHSLQRLGADALGSLLPRPHDQRGLRLRQHRLELVQLADQLLDHLVLLVHQLLQFADLVVLHPQLFLQLLQATHACGGGGGGGGGGEWRTVFD